MDWNQHLNQYCERTSEAFWSEPLNAITNLAFILAALFALKALQKTQKNAKNAKNAISAQTSSTDYSSLFLIGLLAIIGIGSFLFHTFATFWAMLADVIPIAIFMLAYFFLATRRYFAASYWIAGITTLVFFAFMAFGPNLFSPILGSTSGYAPALLAIFLFAILVRSKNKATSNSLWCAGIIFAISMIFRILDEPVCSIIPVGTHSLWHILNATVLFILIRAFIRFKTYIPSATP